MIRFITDSASDISKEDEQKYNIRILPFPITVGERALNDRDLPEDEYYTLIENCPEVPHHSQITLMAFEEEYKKAAEEGCDSIIVVSINSHGSATYNNAVMAVDSFAENYPELSAKVKIYTIDSGSYSAGIGYPVIKGAKMAAEGVPAAEIAAKIEDSVKTLEVYLGCYNLRFVKKSGRVSAAAAFAGELLGFRPVILLKQENTKTVAKVRGDDNVVKKIAEITAERIVPGTEYAVIGGKDLSHRAELAKVLTKKLGYPPIDHEFRVGGVISANAGPDVVASVVFHTKEN